MSSDSVILGRKQIAHEARVSERTVSRWARSGILPAAKPGGQTSPLRVERRDLESLINKRK